MALSYPPNNLGGAMAGRRKGSASLTPLELRIMQALWEQGPCSVNEVRDKVVQDEEPLAYNTVQTMLNVLHRKGRVARELNGRAYIYRAKKGKDATLHQMVSDLIERMFAGSPEELVMSLIKTNQVDLERIAELSKRLALEEGSEADERR
jgi:predicted transcriptional regulator